MAETREKLIELINDYTEHVPHEEGQTWEEAFADHLIANGVTVQECGEWAHLGGDEWCCSVCGFVISTEGSWEKPIKKHCEECGAKMQIPKQQEEP